ncbi:MAG: RluA family pseudouridine synthase, partial [Candidatus Cryptobacteroides sp.]
MSVAGNRQGVETAYSLANDYILHKYNGRRKAHVLHRLDRDTSGVLVFAKDYQVKRAMTDHWNESILERRYVAVLDGVPAEAKGRVESWLTENDRNFMVYSSLQDNGGEYAATNYEVLKSDGVHSLVAFNLETGRKNQIRVQAATHLGCPVAGDPKYGNAKSAKRLCLHANGLSFIHPITRKIVRITSNTPRFFNSLV